jgi:deoxyhypusine monooxygenase
MFEAPPLSRLREAIANPSEPIGMRMRAAYFLRQAYENAIKNKTDENEQEGSEITTPNNSTIDTVVIETLGKGLSDAGHGSLLRHEFAYVMGQLRDERCCPILEKVLIDESDCVIVRHECGEALGAIGAKRSIPSLEKAIENNPNSPEIGQTCQLALDFMAWKARGGEKNDMDNQPMVCACMLSPYSSVDPAPPHPKHVNMSTAEIGEILRDESQPLFERYRAMFSLRNRGGSECVLELGRALLEDTSSPLFRHEVAYVCGQLQHDDSVEALAESLGRKDEHAMVRHESAEALSAIEGRWDEVEIILKSFLEDEDIVVRESCVVALDAADYWGHANSNSNNDIGGAISNGNGNENGVDDDIAANNTQREEIDVTFAKVKAQAV